VVEVKALQGQVRHLVEDLRVQVPADAKLLADLKREYAEAASAGRTASGSLDTWLEDQLDQAAVAWVLGCVFVRFCEDNGLVDGVWIGGPEKHATVEQAVRRRQAYLVANPERNDRHWLREAFGYLGRLSATGRIFDSHNPLWRFGISGEAAEALSDFFRRGAGSASLRRDGFDTRFLGDLYQDLSAYARDTYALLQTPEFVEKFILDRAFQSALNEFGLANMSVIDPTCGSGHFLLGAFERLVRLWKDREPGTDVRVLVERALGQVTGVDTNAAAVAIARFRLMVAALKECRLSSLERVPDFPVRVATGDSLLPWGDTKGLEQGDLLTMVEGTPIFAYYYEDEDLLKEYLRPAQYTVVVGNPPYITAKDKGRNELYRGLYSACSGKYALTVPFAQRFFELAKRGDHDGDGAGWVGQITANSFMKREFGKKLINEYFAGQVDLSEVIDASGAFIPGHGTPTVILVGRNRFVSPRYSGPIRAVLGIRGEPGQPADPARGLVWLAIVSQVDKPGSESAWISVANLPREHFATYPWSLTGGGAADLLITLNEAPGRLGRVIDGPIGFASFPGREEAFFAPDDWFRRRGVEFPLARPLVIGESVRDWDCHRSGRALAPYGDDLKPIALDASAAWARHLWAMRRTIGSTTDFGGQTRADAGGPWWTWYRWVPERYRTPLSVTFAGLATHNHFVLYRGGKVFNQWAPVIKLPEGASEDEHLRLLGVLNSSTACFWLKQVCHDKGIRGQGGGFTSDDWEHFYEVTGTKLQEFPLPSAYPLEMSRKLDGLAQWLATVTPAAVAESGVPTRDRLKAARDDWHSIRSQMIALQEELDWQVYRLYGLTDEELTTVDPPRLDLGQRAFEIVLARSGSDTQWFARHGSTPITDLPDHWTPDYRKLVEQRIATIESDRNIALIERPECKRRWATPGWDTLQTEALRTWLLDRIEALWQDAPPTPLSVAQLADRMRHDEDFRAVLDLWVGHDQHDLAKTLAKLVADEHVPYLPAGRYKPSGLRKRIQWERTWADQRREDAGEDVTPDVPPKYSSADFLKHSYWRNRGKLDVPKERFISYPGAERDGDPTLLLGWAGWDQVAQAQALATMYLDRKTHALWPRERLLPLLAGVFELLPWLRQWHSGPRPGFPGSPAEFFTSLVDTELSALGADRAALDRIRGVEVPA
jgi:hypothetical protein